MATSFKDITQDDRKVTRTMLHESIPVTGTLMSGTYAVSGTPSRGLNIKTFGHGMFQSVYDYPYASSSANHILDLTFGCSTADHTCSGSSTSQVSLKVNIYNQMAQILAGYDTGSNIRRFDIDGDLDDGGKHDNIVFMNFARLLTKDELKKGSFSFRIGTSTNYAAPFSAERTITDSTASTNYKINSPAGEYGILKTNATAASVTLNFTNAPNPDDAITILALHADGSTTTSATFTCHATIESGTQFGRDGAYNGADNLVTAIGLSTIAALVTVTRAGNVVTVTQVNTGAAGNTAVTSDLANVTVGSASAGANGAFTSGHTQTDVGLLYYQAGIAALTSSIFDPDVNMTADSKKMHEILVSKSIDEISDAVRHRVRNVSFNNTTELNSSIYFCRAHAHEFNYSSNPTYLDTTSKIRVKNHGGSKESENAPISYITTVGLYSFDNELLAVAKLSEPIKKTNSSDLTLRVRLDY
jgi:hypothetical protein